jgi:hypothetical protein
MRGSFPHLPRKMALVKDLRGAQRARFTLPSRALKTLKTLNIPGKVQ